MDARKLLVVMALSVGGLLAMTCVNMDGGGRIAGKWGGECHGTSTMLVAKGGRMDLKRGTSHWDVPFQSGDENIANVGRGEIRFHVDGLTRDLELALPGQEPCFLKRL